MSEDRRHRVITPAVVTLRKISQVKESANGHPYYWFELEDMEYGYVAARTMWGKWKEDGSITWDRIGRDELSTLLSTKQGLAAMRAEIRFALINPDDWSDILDPKEWIVPPAVIWFLDELLVRAVRESKRPIPSDSAEARHVLAINRDRGGPF